VVPVKDCQESDFVNLSEYTQIPDRMAEPATGTSYDDEQSVLDPLDQVREEHDACRRTGALTKLPLHTVTGELSICLQSRSVRFSQPAG